MSARLTIFLRTVVMASFVVAFTSVAQTDSQRGRDEHPTTGERPADQNNGRGGQQYRPEQQQNGQPQQQYRHQQPQQQYQQQPQQQQPQQQYQRQPQQQQPQQQYQRQPQQQQPQQQYQQQPQQQYQQRGNQQQYQQRGDQQRYQQRGDQYGRESNRGGQQYRPENRPQQWGRPPAHRPSYAFRPNDRNSLRRYYGSRFGAIDRAHRPSFRIGGYLPYEDLAFISPVPPEVWGSLPPIPYGYVAGYWDGYVVVYDPETGYILYVSDLLY